MSEVRRDPIIGRWVIVYKPENSLGPADYEKSVHTLKQGAVCQFCNGREAQTPPEVDAIRAGYAPNTPGWLARVVPNKFPALRIEGELNRRGNGVYDMSNGVGAHEVLVETPDHAKNFADYSLDEAVNVIKMYQSRSASLGRDKRFKYIMIFKNFGQSAGASVEHAHSQIIALPLVPKYVAEELEGAEKYYGFRGRCVFCDMIQQEYQDQRRIITSNDGFLSFCPFVPRYPFESWIFPKDHNSDFVSMQDLEREQLAGILKDVLLRMKICLSNPSYNFYLHVKPVDDDNKSYHWHIEIVPQLTRVAGFEWGTGFYVVRTAPSVAAEYLRGAIK
ncbi:MAG: galactose-1-phosphate uridylyltransferase [Candidatus Omnitrophica bacterium]|nr:galactose-1-phosphate uridylyltransferase [Candidatus Omnitrophota bacterium]